MTDIEAFAQDLDTELRYEADLEGSEAMMAEVFTRRMIETLVEAGEVEEAVDCHWQDDSVRPAVEVAGYGITDGTLTLIATIYRGPPSQRVSRSDVQRQIRRARAFWDRCRTRPYHEELEESSDAWDMALHLHRMGAEVTRVQIFCVTDGYTLHEYHEPELVDGVEHREDTWDLVRLWRLAATGRQAEPVDVDFVARFGAPLPALRAPAVSDEYDAYMAFLPGDWLANVYDEFGHRLLERNVRSFLQFTGSTNKGMRETIRARPSRFLAYNNGISATAAEVRLATVEGGGTGIASIRDLQIVNGGQTTASVHRSMREKVDVSKIAVQAKITVVDGPLLDELVPDISRYANTQNKIQQADLSSNDPFHIRIQQLAGSVWAPATRRTPRQTRWFYERARGQYQDALGRESTAARRRSFTEMHPPRQKITKVQLATYENTWNQRPHEVSKGAQKNFGDFMTQLRRNGDREPDAAWWQAAIAKAIIFRSAENIVSSQSFGGYRRNIVAYAVARLSAATDERLDLHHIFVEQQIPAPLADAIEQLAHRAWDVLTDSSRAAQNVTEWAKRPDCWTQMQRQPFEISGSLRVYLQHDSVSSPGSAAAPSTVRVATHAQGSLRINGVDLDASDWATLANWCEADAEPRAMGAEHRLKPRQSLARRTTDHSQTDRPCPTHLCRGDRAWIRPNGGGAIGRNRTHSGSRSSGLVFPRRLGQGRQTSRAMAAWSRGRHHGTAAGRETPDREAGSTRRTNPRSGKRARLDHAHGFVSITAGQRQRSPRNGRIFQHSRPASGRPSPPRRLVRAAPASGSHSARLGVPSVSQPAPSAAGARGTVRYVPQPLEQSALPSAGQNRASSSPNRS